MLNSPKDYEQILDGIIPVKKKLDYVKLIFGINLHDPFDKHLASDGKVTKIFIGRKTVVAIQVKG